ncbi:hypothetical protein KSP39_PZI005517 [Platanthera zijinensis]|uniref:MMS19 nucleotide excision repair protein n=1 Tax=Platanthera zijinensis TaxID=2320716 RepID=A0AAP0BSD4_9ASPA
MVRYAAPICLFQAAGISSTSLPSAQLASGLLPSHPRTSATTAFRLAVIERRFDDLAIILSSLQVSLQRILFLAEVLIHLLNKSLDSFTLSTLAGFFSSRLADWRSLHGALVGCLALLRRKSNVGMIVDGDARKIAQSMLDNVQVQLLAMIDRKICFEVFQCLLDVYSEAVATLGDDFVYGFIQAVDQEKDPRCLVLTFHLIQSFVKLFVLELGSTHIVHDLFEVLSCYFPIYFTHPAGDDFEVKREDLSDALMNAFCSTPEFEPFAIPLLLDKLSSTLPVAKIDSLKYLNKCLLSYGSDKMEQHAQNIWFALKVIILGSLSEGENLSSSVSGGEINSDEQEIAREALVCLKTAVSQFSCHKNDDFLTLIVSDNDIERSFCSVTMEGIYRDNSNIARYLLRALGSIFYVMANSSIFCCNRVIEILFPRLMDILGIHSRSSEDFPDSNIEIVSQSLNCGALYLCVELLTSCRDLIATVWEESSIQNNSLEGSWWHLIQGFSGPLSSAFRSALMIPNKITAETTRPSSYEHYVSDIVRGLQVLATYPGDCTPVTKESLENILVAFMSVIIGRSEESFLWKLSLKSFVVICSSEEQVHGGEKATSNIKEMPVFPFWHTILEEKMYLHVCSYDSNLEVPRQLIASSNAGMSEEGVMGLFVEGSLKAAPLSTTCPTRHATSGCIKLWVLPLCHNFVSIEQPGMHFAISILEQMENVVALKMEPDMQDLLDKMMMCMKLVVSGCAEDNQRKVLEKAYDIILASTNLPSESRPFCSSIFEGLLLFPDIYEITYKNKWLMYFFASIVIALRPQTSLTNGAKWLNILLLFTLKGHLPAAQALASLVNKLPSNVDKLGSSDADILEETIQMILETFLSVLANNPQSRPHMLSNSGGASVQLCLNLQVHAVVGMTWFGKGLLMRGHSRVKDISLAILKCLISSQDMTISLSSHHGSDNCIGEDMQHLVARSAADAFHILLSDSESCLNKKFHAIIRPLYKQRFFSSMLPVLLSAIKECNSSRIRIIISWLCGSFFLVLIRTPLAYLQGNHKQLLYLVRSFLLVSVQVLHSDYDLNVWICISETLELTVRKAHVKGSASSLLSASVVLAGEPYQMALDMFALFCNFRINSLPHTRWFHGITQQGTANERPLRPRKRLQSRPAVGLHHHLYCRYCLHFHYR